MAKNKETLEIKDPYKDYFGFTFMRDDIKNPVQKDYEHIIKVLNKRTQLLSVIFENKDKHGNDVPLHIHGTFICKRNPYLKPFLPPHTHVHLCRIHDFKGWTEYTLKNKEIKGPAYPTPLF